MASPNAAQQITVRRTVLPVAVHREDQGPQPASRVSAGGLAFPERALATHHRNKGDRDGDG